MMSVPHFRIKIRELPRSFPDLLSQGCIEKYIGFLLGQETWTRSQHDIAILFRTKLGAVRSINEYYWEGILGHGAGSVNLY